jgi:hypothetical protein
MKILLRVRDLETDQTNDIELPDEAAAKAWVVARPRMREVLGVPTEGVPIEVSHGLKAAMRPLEADEHEAVERLDLARKQEMERRSLERKLAAERADAEEAKRIATADPQPADEGALDLQGRAQRAGWGSAYAERGRAGGGEGVGGGAQHVGRRARADGGGSDAGCVSGAGAEWAGARDGGGGASCL